MVKFNRDGDLMYTSAKDSMVYLSKSATGELWGSFDGHNGAIFGFDISHDGKIMVTASADGTVRFWEALTGQCFYVLDHGGIVKFCEWNTKPLAQTKIVTCNDRFRSKEFGEVKDRVCVWHYTTVATAPEKSEPELILTIDKALPMKATKCAWGPFDETLLTIHEEGTVFQWNSMTGEELKYIQGHRGPITDMQFSDDRLLMLTSSKDQTIKVWQLADFEIVKDLKTDRPCNSCSISPLCFAKDPEKIRYHVLAGGGQDAGDVTTQGGSGKFEAVLIHLISEEDLGTIRGHFGPMNYIRFMPDGSGFATGGEDGYVRIHHFEKDYFNPKKWN
jgi:translation initiation factor 3 subunit I